jgi:hypothetical protein
VAAAVAHPAVVVAAAEWAAGSGQPGATARDAAHRSAVV